MYFNESLNQANASNEFHPAGTTKIVEKRQSSFPWRLYKEHYIWKQVVPGGYGLVYHNHPNYGHNPVGHYEFRWVWTNNEYPFFH